MAWPYLAEPIWRAAASLLALDRLEARLARAAAKLKAVDRSPVAEKLKAVDSSPVAEKQLVVATPEWVSS